MGATEGAKRVALRPSLLRLWLEGVLDGDGGFHFDGVSVEFPDLSTKRLGDGEIWSGRHSWGCGCSRPPQGLKPGEY
jgi:hypothetical protein